MYIIVTQLATSELVPAAKVDSYHKFFWGSADKHVWGDVARQIGKALKAKGLVETAEAKSVSVTPDLMYVFIPSLSPMLNALGSWQTTRSRLPIAQSRMDGPLTAPVSSKPFRRR